MITLLFSGLGMGFAIVASPGAVTAKVIPRGLQRGFASAFVLQLGAVVGLAIWAVVAFIGSSIIARYPLLQLVLGIVGSSLLLYLGWDAVNSSRYTIDIEEKATDNQGDFALGLALSLTNPLPLAFWLGFGNSITGRASAGVEPFAVFLIGFIASALLWSLLLAALLAWGGRFARPAVLQVVNRISGILLGFFALKLLWDTIHLILLSS